MTNQATLLNTLVDSAKKKLNGNGNPFYRVPVELILEAGISNKTLRENAKQLGARFVENDKKISFCSYNLRHDLQLLVKEAV